MSSPGKKIYFQHFFLLHLQITMIYIHIYTYINNKFLIKNVKTRKCFRLNINKW